MEGHPNHKGQSEIGLKENLRKLPNRGQANKFKRLRDKIVFLIRKCINGVWHHHLPLWHYQPSKQKVENTNKICMKRG